jgi:glycosyltransferase involved in cell wall biosynthesis
MSNFQVLQISTRDMLWGSAKAAYRLNYGLRQLGVASTMLVQNKLSDDPSVVLPGSKIGKVFALIQPFIDGIPLRKYRKKLGSEPFSCGFSPGLIGKAIREFRPDLVHLHWIGNGFLRIETLRNLQKPIIWTLHDSWPFTGGCHLPGDCRGYTENCGNCPRIKSNKKNDVTRWVWNRKKRSFRNITVVTPSKWLEASVESSSLLGGFPHCVIPNGIDTDTFRPLDKGTTRGILGLPQNRKLILFGAFAALEDKNKGFSHLVRALEVLKGNNDSDDIDLVFFGGKKAQRLPNFPIPYWSLGTLFDEISLSLAYNSADVFVIPSEQENYPNTILEAAACGIPSVAFSIGGIPELIQDKKTGFLARPFDCHELAAGIRWVLKNQIGNHVLSTNTRENVLNKNTVQNMSQKYLQIYETVLKARDQI